MNRLTIVPLALLVAASAHAQRARHANTLPVVRPMPAPVNAIPYGNILFPGGIGTPHPVRLGGTISGSIPYTGVGPGGRGRGPIGRNRTVVVPYAMPIGGYYGVAGYGYPEPQPNVTVVMPQQAPPNIIINQYDSESGERRTTISEQQESGRLKMYEATPRRPEAPVEEAPRAASRPSVHDEKPNIYFIALKDETVRQAIGYWVKNNELHYVTPQAKVTHVSLDLVDREASERLNAERKLEFELPPAQ